jgi:hypothetical protein
VLDHYGRPCPLPFTPYPLPLSSEAVLPLHRSFFRRVNLCLFIDWKRLVEEESLDVIEQEILGVGTGEIKTVMIDYLRLLLQPGGPAGLTDLFGDSLTQFVGKGREANRRSFLAAVFAFNVFCHSISRPKGPTFNSHARKGVEGQKEGIERRRRDTSSPLNYSGPNVTLVVFNSMLLNFAFLFFIIPPME